MAEATSIQTVAASVVFRRTRDGEWVADYESDVPAYDDDPNSPPNVHGNAPVASSLAELLDAIEAD